jgi:predicted nucleic acid-binding protein
MARYAVDARTLLHVVERKLVSRHQLVAPNFVRSEALELLLSDVRRGRRSDEDALATHEQMTELKLRLLGDRVSRRTAWKIARDHKWERLRDAEYVAVAKLQADALVTVDAEMASRAAAVVPIVELDAVFKRASGRVTSRRASGRSGSR